MSNENSLQYIFQKYFKTHTMKIEPCYVEFSQAKLLKEKGFEQSTNGNYWILAKDHTENYNKRLPVNEDKVFFCKNSEELSNKTRIDEKYYENTYHVLSVPEQWQVVEFFRIVHGIWIEVIMTYPNKWEYNCLKINSGKQLAKVHSQLNTPQEAYSKAISYCLENII